MVLPAIMLMAALSAPGESAAPASPALPVLLAVDAVEKTVALERAGQPPNVLALDEMDAEEHWILRSVSDESAIFVPTERGTDTPVRIRVYLKASGRAPMVVRDRIEVPAVPRLVLSPVRSMTAAEITDVEGTDGSDQPETQR